jgi:hypothetical protein
VDPEPDDDGGVSEQDRTDEQPAASRRELPAAAARGRVRVCSLIAPVDQRYLRGE